MQSGNDDIESVSVYLEHIDKRAGAHYPLESYIPAFIHLIRKIRAKGYDHNRPIMVNRDYMILEGAHRTTACHVLGQDISVSVLDTDFHWPLWGREWFEEHMPAQLPWLMREWESLSGEQNGNE